MHFPIRQNLSQLTGLNRTDRAIAELVAELAEHGGKGYCHATNETLGKRVQATQRTVSRVLAKCLRLGLLVISGRTSGRRLVASPLLRLCYASETKEACEAATAALSQRLSARKKAPGSDTLPLDNGGSSRDIPGPALTTIGAPALDIPGRAYKETRNHEQKDEQDEKASLRAALARVENELADAKKKIAALETQPAAQRAAGDFLKAHRPAAHTRAPKAVPLRFPEWATAAFRAQWNEWVAYRQGKPNPLAPASLQKMLDQLAAFDEGYCQLLFNKAIASGYIGLVFDDTALKFALYLKNQTTPAAYASPSPFQHPERGAKPTAHAAFGARALSAQLRALREHGSAEAPGPLALG